MYQRTAHGTAEIDHDLWFHKFVKVGSREKCKVTLGGSARERLPDDVLHESRVRVLESCIARGEVGGATRIRT